MAHKRYQIKLTEAERTELLALIRTGKERARKLMHASILLEADESGSGSGLQDKAISERVHVSVPTIARVRKRWVEEGLESALKHKRPYRTRAKNLDGVAANLTHIAGSQAPRTRPLDISV